MLMIPPFRSLPSSHMGHLHRSIIQYFAHTRSSPLVVSFALSMIYSVPTKFQNSQENHQNLCHLRKALIFFCFFTCPQNPAKKTPLFCNKETNWERKKLCWKICLFNWSKNGSFLLFYKQIFPNFFAHVIFMDPNNDRVH